MGAGLRKWIRAWAGVGARVSNVQLGSLDTFWTVLGLKGHKFQIFTDHGLQTPV